MHPSQSRLRNHQRKAFVRGVGFLLNAYDILGRVKIHGWTQANVLHEAYVLLAQAAEQFVEVSPNDLAVPTRQRITRGLDNG